MIKVRHSARTFLLLLALVLLSCGKTVPPQVTQEVSSSPPYRPITNVRQTMWWILDPAADLVWDSAGTIITAEGRRELAPTTQEGWDKVRNAAAILAETGNLLMMPGRSVSKEWNGFARDLQDAGQLVMGAAQAQDSDALFDAGGELYQVCLACHNQYMLPLYEARRRAAAAGGESSGVE